MSIQMSIKSSNVLWKVQHNTIGATNESNNMDFFVGNSRFLNLNWLIWLHGIVVFNIIPKITDFSFPFFHFSVVFHEITIRPSWFLVIKLYICTGLKWQYKWFLIGVSISLNLLVIRYWKLFNLTNSYRGAISKLCSNLSCW